MDNNQIFKANEDLKKLKQKFFDELSIPKNYINQSINKPNIKNNEKN